MISPGLRAIESRQFAIAARARSFYGTPAEFLAEVKLN
jgi:hypothetical protein